MKEAVERTVKMMRENLGEPITIDDMARTAMYSKFHFTRVFQRATGVSPGRFLSALRLEKAKQLLLSTSLSITEISYQVGYSSVGTFSTRFKNSVGLAPTEFRQRRGAMLQTFVDGQRCRQMRSRTTTIRGKVLSPRLTTEDLIFLGLFPDCIPQGAPVSCAILRDGPGLFSLNFVPPGTWHLLALSVTPCHEGCTDDEIPYVGAYGPISVRADAVVTPIEVELRPAGVLDPPVLVALLDAGMTSLEREVS
jgi:AraC family transcriptional regulator